ncbi:MAG: superinfection immunity protein [Candidatus Pacebacteria bacterium]|jgi:hypothetical protein|nr:superinfection immunity protein [Candidatus Paceibacterota bacterium]
MIGEFFALMFVLFLSVYFLPTLVAIIRGKRNIGAIFVLNLLLGWSFIGWVLALVWALVRDTDPSNPAQSMQPPAQIGPPQQNRY